VGYSTSYRETMSPGGNSTWELWRRRTSDKTWVLSDTDQTSYDGIPGYQSKGSESHPWPPKGGLGDVGGPFDLISHTAESVGGGMSIDKNARYTGVSGYDRVRIRANWTLRPYMGVDPTNPTYPTSLKSSDSTLNTLGASAISRCRPTASGVDLSTALGELHREGLPHLSGSQTWRERTLRARDAGSEFLNVEFGWLPLVRDVLSFGSTVRDSRDIVSQYDRDVGRVVRRQYTYPEIRTKSSGVSATSKYPEGLTNLTQLNAWPGFHTGPVYYTSESVKRRWFKGAFIYGGVPGFVPTTPLTEFGARADRLFGISLTPDVLWNLSPWSWAADWFGNVGDVLSTSSDMLSQGLVMRYGYMMENTINKYTYSHEGVSLYGESIRVPPVSLVVETKTRRRANPFGFGILWDGLSPTQVAILTALGISRS